MPRPVLTRVPSYGPRWCRAVPQDDGVGYHANSSRARLVHCSASEMRRLRRESRSERWPGVEALRALREVILVHADLRADHVKAIGERLNLTDHLLPVLAQQREPIFFIAGSLPDEICVLADHRQRHAGGTQRRADGQPLDVLLAIDPAPAHSPSYRKGKNPLALIEAQRVNAQTRPIGNLSDAQT
jgi:hypothetical protein